ncbi:MAG: UDP-GlcNAc:undecaprenyl-phosphate/decaprenyl-phosphate GlcNAc-phosphate transferase [Gaiellaceae bacterium]|jgi:UDP-GlcNAc:undecaprenyl-phosphate GlcNAc-1-phosphate transferase|nr:UDP-GlcNAc:undecaprenyl-phosphate/decaprenyl-phosphate GlcNAc-phosphate transferase [Gaiellaceae bacterium]
MDALRDHPEVLYGAGLACLIVILLTPAVGGMARLLGVVDRPESRRLNVNPVPRLGGLAIFFGIFVPALAFLELGRESRGVLLGAAVATVVGAIDDFRVLKPGRKLAGQVVAASIPPFFGVWIDHFTFPVFGPVDLPNLLGMPLTVIWIVAVMNMVNFLDGMDGLAAGVCAIAGVTFAILALSLGKSDPAILSAIVAGACIGFLRHNFFPARIFMGDSGALALGFLLAAVSVQGLLKTASTVVLLLPLLVLAVPILDTSFVVARRLKHGQRISAPDQAHLHFRFLRRGFSQRRAAVTMWAWCATLAGAALATRFIPFREGGAWHLPETLAVAAIALVALSFSLYVVYVLEIVKLSNPRRFWRGRHGETAEERRSA